LHLGGGGGGGGGANREARHRGSDLRYDLQIRLEEAAGGCEKEIEITKLDACGRCTGSGAEPGSRAASCPTCGGRGQVISSRGFFQVSQTCPRCRGIGQIVEKPCKECAGEGRIENTSRIKLKIPAGIEDGSRLRSSRNGEAGIRGGPPGDLYVVIHVKEHEIFEREEDNLFCEIPVKFVTAAVGGEVRVPTLEGEGSLKIPAGTQGGALFKLRGKGMPGLSTGVRGDLLVRVLVEVPTRLNAEQKRKLEEFAELMGDENTPLHKSFFEKAKEFFK
jgi:molecular chaperone DnaJ